MSLQDLDAEHCLLLACAIAPAGTDLSGALSGERLLAVAAAHRVLPQLAAQVLRAKESQVQAIKVEVEAAARANHGRGVFMAGELVRVLDALRGAGILAVPFKGPAFAELLGDGPGTREMDDLDLLLPPADLTKAAQVLAPLGYSATLPPQALASPWLARVACEIGLSAHQGETLVELHWRPSPHWFPAACALEDVMARLDEREFFGHRAPWPAPEELLLLQISDGMKSCGSGMRWIGDVVRVLRHHVDMDWERVQRIAATRGGLGCVRVALAVAEALCGEVARQLAIPSLALSLPAPAQALAADARQSDRLGRAVQSIRANLLADVWVTGAAAHFKWALQLADHPARVAVEIARYLAGPSVADLAAMPERGESDLALRCCAFWRRLGRGRATPSPARAGS